MRGLQDRKLHTPPAIVNSLEVKFGLLDLITASYARYQDKAIARYKEYAAELGLKEVCAKMQVSTMALRIRADVPAATANLSDWLRVCNLTGALTAQCPAGQCL